MGKGVTKAVANVNDIIAPALIGKNPTEQKAIDDLMITLDGTDNKGKLGANAILAVSMAVCKAGAAEKGVPLYKYIAELAGNSKLVLPVPSFNVINGGEHAGNGLAMQEFMILPTGAASFTEAMRMGAEVYHNLKALIKEKYGLDACNVGDEGGFAPNIADNEEGLKLLQGAIAKAGYEGKVKIGMDVAASEFFTDDKCYDLKFKVKGNDGSGKKTGAEMLEMYKGFIDHYGVITIEDPYEQDDWDNWKAAAAELKCQIVGDDQLVTNPKRIKDAIAQKAANALLLKINQIGTISESIEAVKMAKAAGWGVMASHRSGETEDTFIADLAVGLSTGQIKTGAPCRCVCFWFGCCLAVVHVVVCSACSGLLPPAAATPSLTTLHNSTNQQTTDNQQLGAPGQVQPAAAHRGGARRRRRLRGRELEAHPHRLSVKLLVVIGRRV
jgi:enolase